MTILLPEDVFINALSRSIRWDTSHTNSSRYWTEELINSMQKNDADSMYKKKAHTCNSYIFMAFSNCNECCQITEVASINAPRKPVKVSETVHKTLQQPAGNSLQSEDEDLH